MKGVTIDRSTSGRSVQSKPHLELSSKGIQFKTGQVFQGKVTGLRANGSILVQTQGKTFEAITSVPLRRGTSHEFLVKTTTPRVELKVLKQDDLDAVLAGRRWLAGRKDRILFGKLLRDLASTHSLKNLKPFLPLLLFDGSQKEDAQWLFRNLLSSGIFWENKVFRHLLLGRRNEPVTAFAEDDLKGMLLSLKKGMGTGSLSAREAQEKMAGIDRMLSFLENHQNLNLDMLREGWGWYWFIPGSGQRGLLHGELFGRKTDDGDLHRLNMDLVFSELGQVHVGCVLRQKAVSLSLRVEDEAIGRFLEKNMGPLKEAIEKKGLLVTRVACETVSDATLFYPFSPEKGENGLMDLVI